MAQASLCNYGGNRVDGLIARGESFPNEPKVWSGSHQVKDAEVPAVIPRVVEVAATDIPGVTQEERRQVTDRALPLGETAMRSRALQKRPDSRSEIRDSRRNDAQPGRGGGELITHRRVTRRQFLEVHGFHDQPESIREQVVAVLNKHPRDARSPSGIEARELLQRAGIGGRDSLDGESREVALCPSRRIGDGDAEPMQKHSQPTLENPRRARDTGPIVDFLEQ